jgi:alpha-glucoside transport system substrate-binding protein
MPAVVGAGSFWSIITDYVAGSIDLDTAMAEIDATWPEGEVGQVDPETEEMAALPPEGSWLARAMAGEFDGTSVEMIGVQVEEEEIRMNKSLEAFEEATGIDVEFIGTKAMETQLVVRSDAGDPFDVVDFPQPGAVQSFVDRGEIIDVRDFMAPEFLANYNQGWLDMATYDGPDGDVMAGVWNRGTHKDVVWYNKVAFEAAGYEIPETWDELVALTQLIADDGDPAWCIGIDSGDATGWVATDWIEALMLRTQPPEVYDAWVAGELPFSSDEVKNAVTLMSDIWLNPDYVLGGRDQIVSEFIGDSPAHMFEDPPACWMHKQASWIQDFFGGEELEAGVDWDFFYLPMVDDSLGQVAETAADIMVMFNDRPEVKALMEYFATGQSAEVWVREGGFLSPHQDSSPDWLSTELDQRHAQVLLDAQVVRFDASDLMPAEVGAGSFWSIITDYVAGSIDLDTAMAEIDASWPTE